MSDLQMLRPQKHHPRSFTCLAINIYVDRLHLSFQQVYTVMIAYSWQRMNHLRDNLSLEKSHLE